MVFITGTLLDSLMAISLITLQGEGVVPAFFRHNETTYILSTFFSYLQKRDIDIVIQTENYALSLMVYNKLCQYMPLKEDHTLLKCISKFLESNNSSDCPHTKICYIIHGYLLLVESGIMDVEAAPNDGGFM
jgi:hypothetical protein